MNSVAGASMETTTSAKFASSHRCASAPIDARPLRLAACRTHCIIDRQRWIYKSDFQFFTSMRERKRESKKNAQWRLMKSKSRSIHQRLARERGVFIISNSIYSISLFETYLLLLSSSCQYYYCAPPTTSTTTYLKRYLLSRHRTPPRFQYHWNFGISKLHLPLLRLLYLSLVWN